MNLDVRKMSWQVTLFVGFVTLVLGIIVTLHPGGSLNVVAVLTGILLLVAGLFHLIGALDHDAPSRAWSAIVGLAFVVLGIVFIRHLHLTLALIALLIGVVWIIQGVACILAATDKTRPGRGWTAVFGVISLAAGIVVVAVPQSSLTALAVLLGIWFIVIGVVQVAGAFYIRHALNATS